MGKLNDSVGPKGTVRWEIRRSGGDCTEGRGPAPNAINDELKNKLAATLTTATSRFGVAENMFGDDGMLVATNGKSGIALVDDGNGPEGYYEMDCNLSSTGAQDFEVSGVVRCETDGITITDAKLGHSWLNTSFAVDFSSYEFSPDVDLDDGDQLNVTWEISIDDS